MQDWVDNRYAEFVVGFKILVFTISLVVINMGDYIETTHAVERDLDGLRVSGNHIVFAHLAIIGIEKNIHSLVFCRVIGDRQGGSKTLELTADLACNCR